MSKVSHARHFSKRQSSSPAPGCTNGAFFKSPKAGDTVDTSQDLDIEWDTSLECFSAAGVDIYLYAPYNGKSMIHAWGGIDYKAGSFKTPISGSWWNSTSAPVSLQLGFVESGTPAFMSPVPTGPTFRATFNATDFGLKNPTGGSNSGTVSTAQGEGGGIFQTIGNAYKNAGLPKGSIAAAVIVPLLAIGVAIAVFVKFQRAKEAEKRKRWSQAVDKRMSSISTEWKGLPPGAQSEAIRQSIAIMRDSRASVARMSQLYGADGPRPVSTVVGGGAAGVGARKGTGVGLRNPGAGAAALAQRRSQGKSAISFAADTRFSRPSTDVPALPGRASRAFHVAQNAEDELASMMSPTQVGGPTMLGERDIAPALSMMHHDDADFLMLDHSPIAASPLSAPTPPSPAHLSPTSAAPFTAHTTPNVAYGSPVHSPTSATALNPNVPTPSFPTQRSANATTPNAERKSNNPFEGFTRGPSNMMSPDAMLRAYASREGKPGTPMAVAPPSPYGQTHAPPSPYGQTHAPPSPYGQTHVYPAFDAPVQPQRGDLAPGLPPTMSGRTLYAPGAGAGRVSEGSRYSVADADEEEAYGGYGRAA